MMLNLVKIRYGDTPVFLDVSSVINQYLLESEINGTLGWNAFLPEPSQQFSARGRYADRPTITYQPLQGEKFTRSLMTPIPPDSVMSLLEAGWRADYLFRVCVQSVNGIYNRVGHRMEDKKAHPDFYPLLDNMLDVQESGAVGIRIQKAEGEHPATILFFRKGDVDPDVYNKQADIRKTLGLDPDRAEFAIRYGAIAKDETEISLLTRSMLQILSELAFYIDVPQKHIDEKRAPGNYTVKACEDAGVEPLMRIYSSAEEPDDTFAVIQYRNYWFWIDDKDYMSKRMFSFLMYLFTLAETGSPSQAPILTIPAG